MANLLRKRAVRFPIVVIAAIGWLAISNHCAIAAMEGAAKIPTAHCHGSPAGNQLPEKGGQSGMECCKVLRATLLTLSKNLAACDRLTFTAHTYVVGLIPRADEPRPVSIFEWDTGPPGAGSFAESVLQRSILAHAPPSLA